MKTAAIVVVLLLLFLGVAYKHGTQAARISELESSLELAYQDAEKYARQLRECEAVLDHTAK